jgi:hypothetical protein
LGSTARPCTPSKQAPKDGEYTFGTSGVIVNRQNAHMKRDIVKIREVLGHKVRIQEKGDSEINSRD